MKMASISSKKLENFSNTQSLSRDCSSFIWTHCPIVRRGLPLPFDSRSFLSHRNSIRNDIDRKKSYLQIVSSNYLIALTIVPVAVYYVSIIWEHILLANLQQLNRLTFTYLKRLLELYRLAQHRLPYLLFKMPLLTKGLKWRFDLSYVSYFSKCLAIWKAIFVEIDA